MTNTQCISLFYPLRAFVMAKGHLSGPPLHCFHSFTPRHEMSNKRRGQNDENPPKCAGVRWICSDNCRRNRIKWLE